MRIGLLEDDTNQIELIRLWANEAGYLLQAYTTGKSFREAINHESFDLLLLDWHLPDTSGIDELDWIRSEKSSDVPVIFITNQDSEGSVVEALECGADDYMVKPINKNITLARIKALYRRKNNSGASIGTGDINAKDTDILVFEPYKINQSEHSISINDKLVKLTTKEFELALYLFQNSGCLISREKLMASVWGITADLQTRTVDTHVSRIRSRLSISPAVGWQLSCVYQRGYRLSKILKE